jgi:hypothetical protein
VEILEALKEKNPTLVFLYDLESATRVSRKTLGVRVNFLIRAGLAERPRSERKGVKITAKGLSLLNSHAR